MADEELVPLRLEASPAGDAFAHVSLNPSTLMYSPTLLLVFSFTYALAAGSETWLVKWLQASGVSLIVFFVLLQNASWPLLLYLYGRARREVADERSLGLSRRWRVLILLGVLSSYVSLSKMIALTSLSPIIYLVCSNTEIVWETLLTRFFLKKDISLLQLLAISLVVVAVPLSVYDDDDDDGSSSSDDQTGLTQVLAVAFSLSSRLASSLGVILSEQILGSEAKTKIGVLECALATTVVPFFLAPFALFFVDEVTQWSELAPASSTERIIIAILCFSLVSTKIVDRLSKFSVVQASSTLFFAGTDAASKLLAGIGCYVFFRDQLSLFEIVAYALISIAVALLYVDKLDKARKMESLLASTHNASLKS